MTGPLRVLVVDDSAFMRSAVSRLLTADVRFEVVGQARDGAEAVRLARELHPHVITMDFNMPGMNGAEATRAILAERPIPIVMLSAHTTAGARETVQALSAGAVDFVTKPDGEVSAHLGPVRDELMRKLVTAAGANLAPSPQPSRPRAAELDQVPRSVRALAPGLRVVVVASSTGGPAALSRLLPRLQLSREAVLIVVQHMPAGFTAALAEQLAERVPWPVREAQGGELLEPGNVFVAPGDRHLKLERSGRLLTDEGPLVHGVRPAADVTFKSAAQVHGSRVVGVVLTGMGKDGALGLAAIKAAGGRTIAQDRATSTVYGMPRAAVELGVVDEVAPLDGIGRLINEMVC